MNIYDITVRNIHGEETTLQKYQGQVLLIVNVASGCGLTKQYDGLEMLYRKYRAKGLSILGFPCNQFANQESKAEKEINQFCKVTFDITFDLFSKIKVNGADTHPLYKYLKREQKGILNTELIKWNFTKFLVNREGKVIKRFAPQIKPAELYLDIEELL